MDIRNTIIANVSGVLGFLFTLLGAIAYFFFGDTWQIVIACMGIVLMLFAIVADND